MLDVNLGFLDDLHHSFLHDEQNIQAHHVQLVEQLHEIRDMTIGAGWETLRTEIVTHPIRQILHQDPFTRRCFEKPRGYAGDAVTLDYIYKHVLPPYESNLAREIFQHNINHYSVCKAVRYRRDKLAYLIDTEAQKCTNLKILSVACGHLREGLLSKAVKNGQYSEFVALDQDSCSLDEVRHHFEGTIKLIQADIIDIIRRRVFDNTSTGFDLIYAAGLYDYLKQSIACRLTQSLFALLHPGGKLLIANVQPNIHEAGYMETFMDWHLTCRDVDTLSDLLTPLPQQAIGSHAIDLDPYHTFAYLEIVKKQCF